MTHPQLNELLSVISDKCDVNKALYLINSGVDVNSATSSGCTPLMFAVMPNEFGDHNSPEAVKNMVEALLDVGADRTLIDDFDMSALSYAKQWIDPDWQDQFGKSAVECLKGNDINIFNHIIGLLGSVDKFN